jgi:hypothetical protein
MLPFFMNIMTYKYERKREFRMYGFVPYNLSPIQQGIQFGHAVVEYANEHFTDDDYAIWASRDKTFIILNGGTTNMNFANYGSLNNHMNNLLLNGINIAYFHEPDLGDQLTAVVFLVDDRVWDKEDWPDFKLASIEERNAHAELVFKGSTYEEALMTLKSWHEWKSNFSNDEKEASKIVWLRYFLRSFKLA